MTESDHAIEPLVLGRYALHDQIAAGGMATVHVGRLLGPVGFSRTCAIKRLYPEYARDREFVAMFLDEARLASRVRHTNVVTTLDIVAAQGELFLVMDYVQGEALATLFKHVADSGERAPLAVIVSIMIGALEGLHAAHEATGENGEPLHLVHRDVSPQNILVDVDGVARVLDFGIAKAADRLQETRDGRLKGKPAYMSPEQVTAEPLDRRADVYSAAAVLWEGITGKRLVAPSNQVAMMRQVLEAVHTPLSSIVPDIPPELDALMERALAREAADRIPTALEFATELERICVTPASPRQVGAWVRRMAGEELGRRSIMLRRVEGLSLGSSPRVDAEKLAAAMSAEEPRRGKRDGRASAPGHDSASHIGRSWSRGVDSSASDLRILDSRSQSRSAAPAPTHSRALIAGLAVASLLTGVALVLFGPSELRPSPASRDRAGASQPANAPATVAAPRPLPQIPAVPVPPATSAPATGTPAGSPSEVVAPAVAAPAVAADAPSGPSSPPSGLSAPRSSSPAPGTATAQSPAAARPKPSQPLAKPAPPHVAPPPASAPSAAPAPANPCASPYYIDDTGLKRIKPGCF